MLRPPSHHAASTAAGIQATSSGRAPSTGRRCVSTRTWCREHAIAATMGTPRGIAAMRLAPAVRGICRTTALVIPLYECTVPAYVHLLNRKLADGAQRVTRDKTSTQGTCNRTQSVSPPMPCDVARRAASRTAQQVRGTATQQRARVMRTYARVPSTRLSWLSGGSGSPRAPVPSRAPMASCSCRSAAGAPRVRFWRPCRCSVALLSLQA